MRNHTLKIIPILLFATHAYANALITSKTSMIVTNNTYASETAQQILEAGGNAFDAAIAAGFVLGLTEPASSGIGGGAYAITYTAKSKKMWSYDGRETAPHTAHPDWFLDSSGKPLAFMQAVLSAKSIGVPSEIAMFYKLHQEQGKLPWKQLLAPAIALAEKGFPLRPLLHDELQEDAKYLTMPAVKELYFQNNAVKPVDSLIKNPAYANTLRIVAENPADFYQGKLASEIIADINHAAGSELFNKQDFADYKVKRYAPVCSTYRAQYQICSAPPSTSGGVTSQELLGIYELRYNGHNYNDSKWMYYFLEAAKLAFADRNQYLADPDFVKQPVTGLLDKKYLQQRSQLITAKAAVTPVAAGVPQGATQTAADVSQKLHGTTSIAIVDKEGNAISLTASIEDAFGSHIFTHGFFLNNELTDFSFQPKDTNGKLIANRVEAGKRPRSSMAPTLVFKNGTGLYALTGSPGGSDIICYVAKNLILMLDMNMGPAASATPNLCSHNLPPVVETTTAPFTATNTLSALGENIVREPMRSGVTNIIRNTDGGWQGASDPRREGLAIGG